MKIIILQFMAIIAMILISCNDKENSVYLKNGSYSECATGKNLTKAQEETAYVEISAVNRNTLTTSLNIKYISSLMIKQSSYLLMSIG